MRLPEVYANVPKFLAECNDKMGFDPFNQYSNRITTKKSRQIMEFYLSRYWKSVTDDDIFISIVADLLQ